MSEGFLSRWSRRKRAVVAAPPAPLEAAPPEAPPPEGAALPDAAPAFDPASLPPVESLTADSDFTAFLRDGVPDGLRRAALRRAWSLDPAIRDFAGPADYAWDFNAPDGMAGFSLELKGDLGRLLAQAIGSGGAPEEKTPEEKAEPSVAEAAEPPVELARLEDPVEPPPLEALDEPEPEALPAPPSSIAEQPMARRRHGGALPS